MTSIGATSAPKPVHHRTFDKGIRHGVRWYRPRLIVGGTDMTSDAVALENGGTEAVYWSDLTEAERNNMDDIELRKIAFEYERDNHNSSLRRMARRGTLETYLATKVRHAQTYAGNLMERGDDPLRAWNRAIRVCLLERDED